MSILFGWAASVVGEKFAKPFTFAVLVILLIGGVFLLGRCSKDDYEDDYKAQIEQTTRSSEATADAAKAAINTLEGRTATEDAIDQIVEETVNKIDQAADADQVRSIVLASVCGTAEHRNDPACAPTAENK